MLTTLNPAKTHPNRQIDHVFVERDYFVTDHTVLIGDQQTNGEYPSDHFGVSTRIGLR